MAKLSEIAAWVGAEWHATSDAEAPGQKTADGNRADGKLDPQAAREAARDAAREVDPDITCVSGIALASPQSVVFAESAASAQAALASAAGAVLLGLDSPVVSGSGSEKPGSGAQRKPVLRVRQPRLAFAVAAKRLKAAEPCRGVHPTAVVAAGARLAAGVTVGAHAVVGEEVELETGVSVGAGCVLGDGVKVGVGTKLYPRVTVYAGTTIGQRVVAHAGAVLGADGFGYARDAETGEYTQFPQQGTLVIEDDVEIGANTTIDRGALEETRIGRGSKLDNLVHIGHNCRIGRNVVIAAQTGISGSSVVEEGAVLGGQVGIGEHALVGPGVILGGGAGVLSGKKLRGPGQVFWGRPALPLKEYLRGLAEVARLHGKGRK